MNTLVRELYNCTVGITDAEPASPMYRAVTKEVVRRCVPVVERLRKRSRNEPKYKFSILDGEGRDVAFKMIRNNATKVEQSLDTIRRDRNKFICLNDNIDHRKPNAEKAQAALRDFYEALLPKRSAFELEDGVRNRFLYVNQLHAWQQEQAHIERLQNWILLILMLLFVLLCCSGHLRRVCRAWIFAHRAQRTVEGTRRLLNV